MPQTFRVSSQRGALGVANLTALVLALGVTLASAPPALATGGDSIASAPSLDYGALQTGGGKRQEFWRLPVFGGDRITFRADLPDQLYVFTLYDPGVDDYTLSTTDTRNFASDLGPGKRQFSLTAPSDGLATLDVCIVNGDVPCGRANTFQTTTYSFTATVQHLTAISTNSIPHSVANARSRVPIVARVQSPAGTPTGTCIVERRVGSHFSFVAAVTAISGACRAAPRAGRGRTATFRVRFEPSPDYLPDSITTRRIGIRRWSR